MDVPAQFNSVLRAGDINISQENVYIFALPRLPKPPPGLGLG